MLYGGFAALLGIVAALINVTSVARGNVNFGLVGIFHVLFGLVYVGGAITFLIGLAMFLIDYAKHG